MQTKPFLYSIAFVFLLTTLSFRAYSQTTFGPKLLNTNIEGETGLGLGVEANLFPLTSPKSGKLKGVFTVSLQYFFPMKDEIRNSIPSASGNGSAEMVIRQSQSNLQLNATAKIYIAGTYVSKFGWFFNLGAGYSYMPYSAKYSITEKDNDFPLPDDEKYHGKGMMYIVGTGLEYRVNNLTFILDGGLYLPPTAVTEENSVTGETEVIATLEPEISNAATLGLGVRFTLGSGGGVRDTRAGSGGGKSVKRARSIRKNRKSYFF